MRIQLFLAMACLLASPASFAQSSSARTNSTVVPLATDSPYTRAFKLADKNADGHLTGAEQDAFKQYREQGAANGQGTPTFVLDANKDGTITTKERQTYRDLRRAYWKQQREQRRAQEQAKRQHSHRQSSHRTRSPIIL